MSADNWAVCPKCVQQARAAHDEQAAAVYAMYGQIPVADFDKARAALRDVSVEDYRTFREDYEFYGAADGEVVGTYRGGCSKCGLSVELEASRRFWSVEDDA